MLHEARISLHLAAVALALMLGSPLAAAQDSRPSDADIRQAVNATHEMFKDNSDGKNADYIPVLANVPSELFGIAVVTVGGGKAEAGDTSVPFAIESISKVFTAALVARQSGVEVLPEKIGVDATGLPFNSVLAIELEKMRTVNPLVNAGAIATASLVQPSGDFDAKWQAILDNMSAFAGRTLEVNEEVYRSESETNQHNKGISVLLESYDHIYDDPLQSTDIYTRQCSVDVTAVDLATMAATLANGGVNPVTGNRVVDSDVAQHVLSLMATAGLYENTGDWLWAVGLPGKSGVGGGIMAVVPGKMGIATFAPPLDEAGNSVKGQLAAEYLSETLELNLFDSESSEN